MRNFLIDSVVLLDFFINRPFFSNDAATIINLAEKNQLQLFITPVILANVYYIFRKKYSDADVKSAIAKILPHIEILPISKDVVTEVFNSDYKDFEDCLQYTAAEHSRRIDAIITRNKDDYKSSELPVLSPNELISLI